MEREIRVRGKAKIRLRPDTVCADIALEGTGKTCEEALSLASEGAEKVKAALAERGFSPEELKSADFRVDAKYENARGENGEWRQVFAGYGYRHALKISFAAEAEKLNAFASAVAASGADPLFSFSYTVKDLSAVREWLLKEAVKDAAKKALVLANAGGLELKGISRIDYASGEAGVSLHPVRPMRLSAAADGTKGISLDLSPEDAEAEESVSVVWTF